MPRSYGITNCAPYAAAPPVGAAGDTYWNTTSSQLFVSDGTQWVQIAAGSGLPATPPRPGYVLTGGAAPPAWQWPPYTVYVSQTGPGVAVGDLVRIKGGGLNPVTQAQADTEPNAEVVGMVVWVSSDEFLYQTHGLVTVGLSGLVPGTAYYLSPTTAGKLTATEPTTPGQVSKPVLLAATATSGVLVNMRGSVIPAPPSSATGTTLIFANAAARDVALPAPSVGQTCFLTSTGEFQVFNGPTAGWGPPWNTAWGQRFVAARTAGDMALGSNTETQVATLGPQLYKANRTYEIRAYAALAVTATTIRALCRIHNLTDGDRVNLCDGPGWTNANTAVGFNATYRFAPTTDVTKEFRLTFQNASGSGSVTVTGTMPGSAFISAQDVGPLGAPT